MRTFKKPQRRHFVRSLVFLSRRYFSVVSCDQKLACIREKPALFPRSYGRLPGRSLEALASRVSFAAPRRVSLVFSSGRCGCSWRESELLRCRLGASVPSGPDSPMLLLPAFFDCRAIRGLITGDYLRLPPQLPTPTQHTRAPSLAVLRVGY